MGSEQAQRVGSEDHREGRNAFGLAEFLDEGKGKD